eukprot:scaffold216477_cov40-Prasinocladus_malaysianus.AAC.1
MLAELQQTVDELLEQRALWQQSLSQGVVEQLKLAAKDIEDEYRPELEQQLFELQALADSLERESTMKEDMVKQLTASLNRSFAAPSAGKGMPSAEHPELPPGMQSTAYTPTPV